MGNILKTALIPLFFILPWALIKLTNSEKTVLQFILERPILTIIIFLPSIWILVRWIVNFIKRIISH
jgi:hypothetical protein